MDATALKLWIGLAFGASGLAGLWLLRKPVAHDVSSKAFKHESLPARSDEERVVQQHRGRLRAIQERTRFSSQSFERDCMTMVRRVSAHPLYTLPLSKTGAAPEGSFSQLLEQTYHALGFRQAILLPPGVPAEEIEPRSFRWTFGVMVASMLNDVRRSAGWSVAAQNNGPTTRTASVELHGLLHPWLEASSLSWLLQDELLVEQLLAFFVSPAGATVFHRLVAEGRKAATGGTPTPTLTTTGATADVPLRSNSPATPVPVAVPAGPASAAVAPPVLRAIEVAPRIEPVLQAAISVSPAPEAESAPLQSEAAHPPVPQEPAMAEVVSQVQESDRAYTALSGTELANDFMKWIATGVGDQTLPVNSPGALLHVVTDGLVLATPGIFQAYATQFAPHGGVDVPTLGKEAQKAVCAQGWHLRGPQNAHLHRFQGAVSADAQRSPMALRAVVIQAPQRFVSNLPQPNPALARLM